MTSAILDCPSAKCTVGTRIIGIVQNDGTVAHLHKPLEVDSDFLEEASRGRSPEQRFRFAGPCAESGCSQWTGASCRVSDSVVELLVAEQTESIPQCGIRRTCRWFRQNGLKACSVCTLVVTQVV